MSSLKIQEVVTAIKISPEYADLAEKGETQKLADLLNANTTKVQSTYLTSQEVVEKYPTGPLEAETLLLKLETARDTLLASSNEQHKLLGSLLKRQLVFLNSQGADFGGVALRLVFDLLTARGVLTATETAVLKAFARPDLITHTEVGEAIKVIKEEANVRA